MRKTNLATIEIRGFKWPGRPTSIAMAYLLGEDAFGQWLGIASGSAWWSADRKQSGVFETSFVKVIPSDAFWTACFNSSDSVVDVDIVLPVKWIDGAVEEVDLELDILRSADNSVRVRDQGEFDRVRSEWAMPVDIAAEAKATCERVRILVEEGKEPFGDVGPRWLSSFLTTYEERLGRYE